MIDAVFDWIDFGLLLAVGFVLAGTLFGGMMTLLEGGWWLLQQLLPG
ncbi:hypothetical protein ACFOD4_07635 [Pseudoroseomonas globiformis]|uniref:Uncharacterized protein n=1 Tax=Teichococcus globiformis TaxID=2307229 RepID=A0ABV7G0B3_9PROT